MKNEKLCHVISILFLLACTCVIILSVLRLQSALVPQIRGTDESVVSASAAAADENVRPEASEAVQPTEMSPVTEWIPPIIYDDYPTSEIDSQSFVDTIVLGNSQAQAMRQFGLLKNADFCTRVGLSIHKVLSDGTATPPISDLYGKQYSKAVFVFGENELGWPYPENFISHYKKVIAKVRELNPGIRIYCQAIFPVTAQHSAADKTGVNNENVRRFNALLEKMCDEVDAQYMPVAPAFFDSSGALPADAATDGVHFSYNYCKIWAGDLSAYLRDVQAEPVETATTAPVTETDEGENEP